MEKNDIENNCFFCFFVFLVFLAGKRISKKGWFLKTVTSSYTLSNSPLWLLEKYYKSKSKLKFYDQKGLEFLWSKFAIFAILYKRLKTFRSIFLAFLIFFYNIYHYDIPLRRHFATIRSLLNSFRWKSYESQSQ